MRQQQREKSRRQAFGQLRWVQVPISANFGGCQLIVDRDRPWDESFRFLDKYEGRGFF